MTSVARRGGDTVATERQYVSNDEIPEGATRVSALSLWLRCRRRAFLQYIIELPDKSGSAANIGTVMHHFVEAHHLNADPSEMTDQQTVDAWDALDEGERETVLAMQKTYAPEVEENGYEVGMEVVAVELRLSNVIGGLLLSGQIDLLYLDHVKRQLVIRDTKTGDKFFQTAERDFQLMAYLCLLLNDPYWLDTFLPEGYGLAIEHEIIKRNKRTAKATPPFIQYNHHTVEIAAAKQWLLVLGGIAEEYLAVIDEADGDPGYYKLWAKGTNECSWYCPFASECGMLDDPEADALDVLRMEHQLKEEAPQ